MILEIESQRAALKISQADLCGEAKVHPTTYCRLKREPGSGRADTFERLKKALQRLREKAAEHV